MKLSDYVATFDNADRLRQYLNAYCSIPEMGQILAILKLMVRGSTQETQEELLDAIMCYSEEAVKKAVAVLENWEPDAKGSANETI